MESVSRLRQPSRAIYLTPSGHEQSEVALDTVNPTLWEPSSQAQERLRQGRRTLLTWDELPEWYRDNEYIRTGYRPITGSTRKSFSSWSYVHNETINIFSHFLPAVAFLVGGWYMVSHLDTKYTNLKLSDYVIFSFFLLTAIGCLGLSTTYHTMCNHSLAIGSLWQRMDYVGIVLLTLGDFVSGIYMVFWCEPYERKIYWGMIGTLGAISIFIMLSPTFQGLKWRTFRVLTFVVTGLSGFAPLAHGIYLLGISQMVKQSGMPYYLVEGGFLILGALVYTTRFPERLSPGTFDIYGSSHQIFHVLVVLATVTQLIGILSAFDYNYHHRVCSIH